MDDPTALPAALLPPDEAARQAALARYQLLDARSEALLDEVVALAARLFGVSNAMLSIIGDGTVLVKAPYNLPVVVERIPRRNSLCAATILGTETAVYENLAVASPPGIDIGLVQQLGLNFYAGHNLRTPDGFAIGTLCLYDGAPRTFSAPERTLLAVLADVVMRLLELRRLLGAQPEDAAGPWEPVYRAISKQLGRLTALAHAANGQVTAPRTAEARAIATALDGLVAAARQQA